nr:Chain P, Hoef-peptide [Hoeflea phototrophica DFL-43]4Z2V_C Chain C, Hoef-peptide [Hoeflea phototrophica DFL-43]4Z2V_P Chain P, Hoef-peptide [Hoeflea phototrophica DFL-43]
SVATVSESLLTE